MAIGDSTAEPTEECAIPDFGAPKQYELPVFTNSTFVSVVDLYFIPYQEPLRQLSTIYQRKVQPFECRHDMFLHTIAVR